MDNLKDTSKNDSATGGSASATDSSADGIVHKHDVTLSTSTDILKLESDETIGYEDLFSFGHSEFVSFDGKDIGFGNSLKAELGNDNTNLAVESKSQVELENLFDKKKKKGITFSNETSGTVKNGLFEYGATITNSAGYSDGRWTAGTGTDQKVKLGDEDHYIQGSAGESSKFGKDYSSREKHFGLDGKLGPVEGGYKNTKTETHEVSKNDKGQEVTTETLSEKHEISGGVECADGVKLKGSVATEETEKFAKTETGATEERTSSLSGKVRLEVDAQKAGMAATMAAAEFNVMMAGIESATKDSFTSTNKTAYGSEKESEDAKKAAEEAQAQQETEEKQAQKSEEEAMKAELEEDQKVSEELDRQSEELMDEYENDRGYDPQEYEEELEDFSYEENDAPENKQLVDFSEDCSEGGSDESESEDYYYGYGY